MLLAKKIFEFHAQVQKCHFGKIEKLPKWHFWTCAWNSKFFLAKSILLKHYENGNKKKNSQLVPGSAKSRIYSGKSTKRGFSKKGLARIIFFSCFRFLWISWRPGTLNWERVVFLPSKTLYRKCGMYFVLHFSTAIQSIFWTKDQQTRQTMSRNFYHCQNLSFLV